MRGTQPQEQSGEGGLVVRLCRALPIPPEAKVAHDIESYFVSYSTLSLFLLPEWKQNFNPYLSDFRAVALTAFHDTASLALRVVAARGAKVPQGATPAGIRALGKSAPTLSLGWPYDLL